MIIEINRISIMIMTCNLYWPLGRSGTVQARSLQYGRTGTDLVSVKSDMVIEKSDFVFDKSDLVVDKSDIVVVF